MTKLTKEVLQQLINDGYSLTEVGDMYDLSTGWVSRLCKKWEITPPKPGHREGKPVAEETKIKIGDTLRQKEV